MIISTKVLRFQTLFDFETQLCELLLFLICYLKEFTFLSIKGLQNWVANIQVL